MHEPVGSGGDEETPALSADGDSQPPARTWVHPSEVGMAQRKRSDRRRGTLMAAALVLGGVSVLSVCIAMGLGSSPRSAPSRTSRDRNVAATVASLTVVHEGHTSTATGVVIDDDGHIAVRASAVADATDLWASSGDREPKRVKVVATDPRADVAIVAMPEGSGRAVVPDRDIHVGDEVLIARAGAGETGPTMSDGHVTQTGIDVPSGSVDDVTAPRLRITIGTTASGGATTTIGAVSTVASAHEPAQIADGAAFDTDGHFVGLVTGGDDRSPELLPATSVLKIALALAR